MAGHRASNQQRGDRGHLGRKIKQSTLMREGTANRNLGRRKGCTEKWVNSHHKAWHGEKFIGNQVYQHNWAIGAAWRVQTAGVRITTDL